MDMDDNISFAEIMANFSATVLRQHPESIERLEKKLQDMRPEDWREAMSNLAYQVAEQVTAEPWAIIVMPDGDGYRVLKLPALAVQLIGVQTIEPSRSLTDEVMKWGKWQKNAYHAEKNVHNRIKQRQRLKIDPAYRAETREMVRQMFEGMAEAISNEVLQPNEGPDTNPV